MNLSKSFNSGLGQYMRKAAHPSVGIDLSNPRRRRGGGSTTMVMVSVVCLCVVVDGLVMSQAHHMSNGTRE